MSLCLLESELSAQERVLLCELDRVEVVRVVVRLPIPRARASVGSARAELKLRLELLHALLEVVRVLLLAITTGLRSI